MIEYQFGNNNNKKNDTCVTYFLVALYLKNFFHKIIFDRYSPGKFRFRYRKGWREIPEKSYRLSARVKRRWRRVQGSRVRIGRKYAKIKVTPRRILIKKTRGWKSLKRAKVRRPRRLPWKARGRRRGPRRGVVRFRFNRIWRSVRPKGGMLSFRIRRKPYLLK